MANLKNVIYLSNEDYDTLVSTGTVTIDGTTLTYDENNVYVTPDKLASTTEDGLMSSSDKVKLDSIDLTKELVEVNITYTTGERIAITQDIYNTVLNSKLVKVNIIYNSDTTYELFKVAIDKNVGGSMTIPTASGIYLDLTNGKPYILDAFFYNESSSYYCTFYKNELALSGSDIIVLDYLVDSLSQDTNIAITEDEYNILNASDARTFNKVMVYLREETDYHTQLKTFDKILLRKVGFDNDSHPILSATQYDSTNNQLIYYKAKALTSGSNYYLQYHVDTKEIKSYTLSSSTTVGGVKYLEDVTLTGASASGTATFVKTINGGSGTFTPTTKYLHKSTGTFVTGVSGGSGSFTPTTKYLNASYTAGTAVTSGTTKYIHFSQGSLPSTSSESVASGSFSTEASMNFNTQDTSDAPYVASITSNSASGTPTTRYLHPSTTSVVTGISTDDADVASSTHTHSITATGTVSLGSNTTSEGGVAYVASLTTGSYTPQGSVTLSTDNFSTTSVVSGVTSDGTTDVVTGITSGSMVGSRSTSGSGATARRTLSVSYTSASASGTTNIWKKTKASGTANAYTGVSSTKPTFSGTAATVATGGTTKYFHPSFTGTSATSGAPSATTNVLTSASASGTTNAITGLSANTTSVSGDITYLQSYSVSGGGASATTKYMKFTKPVLGTKNVSVLSSAGSLPTLTINSTSEGGDAFIESVNSGSVGGSVSLTNTGSSGIQYMESATHTHTAASASGTSSAITNIEASSTNNTGDITYLESATHTHTGASVATSGDAVTGINGGSISKTTKYLELDEEN